MNSTSVVVLFFAGTLFLTLFAVSLVVLLITQKNKQNRFKREKEQLQLELMKTSMEVQEQALDRISQELHDNIGSRLQSVKRNLAAADMPLYKDHAHELKSQAMEYMDEVIKDVRTISHMLNSDYITTNGLVASVKKEVQDVCRTSSLVCNVDIKGDYYSLDDERELLIFRMVQEAISNVIKHADATAMDIEMDYLDHGFTITVKDDGKGIDSSASRDKAGIGLINMRNRAKMVKGNLDIISANGNGTSLKLSINRY